MQVKSKRKPLGELKTKTDVAKAVVTLNLLHQQFHRTLPVRLVEKNLFLPHDPLTALQQLLQVVEMLTLREKMSQTEPIQKLVISSKKVQELSAGRLLRLYSWIQAERR